MQYFQLQVVGRWGEVSGRIIFATEGGLYNPTSNSEFGTLFEVTDSCFRLMISPYQPIGFKAQRRKASASASEHEREIRKQIPRRSFACQIRGATELL